MLLKVNQLLAVFALLISGFIMALLYLLGPILFWVGIAAYSLKFSIEVWVWQKLSIDEKQDYSGPGHLMNHNHTLSVRIEWVAMLIGFGATICWLKFGCLILG